MPTSGLGWQVAARLRWRTTCCMAPRRPAPAREAATGGLRRAYRFRHYVGLEKCESNFLRLLDDFHWSTLGELVASRRNCAAAA